MPIYEYECVKGHPFELKQDFTASLVCSCPKCAHSANRKVSSFSFGFRKGNPSNDGVSKVNPKARRVRV